MPREGGRLLLVGLSTLDVFIRCAEFPRIDGRVYLPDYKMVPGGSAANMASCLSCLGVPTRLCTRVGQDAAGNMVREYLRGRGVDTTLIVEDAAHRTGFSIINLAENGQFALVHCIGANNAISPADLPWHEVERADMVHAGGVMSMEALDGAPLAQLFRRVRAAGKRTSLHTSRNTGRKAALWEVLSELDVLITNRKEAREVSGAESPESAARWFHNRGVGTVAITLGPAGVFASDGGAGSMVPAFPVAAVDTTGCGDGFAAGFVDAVLRGDDLVTCARWGNAIGAHCAQSVGAMPTPFTRNELQTFLQNKMGTETAGG
jgi:sugar/nucleoside kinase (ribokinase family)